MVAMVYSSPCIRLPTRLSRILEMVSRLSFGMERELSSKISVWMGCSSSEMALDWTPVHFTLPTRHSVTSPDCGRYSTALCSVCAAHSTG